MTTSSMSSRPSDVRPYVFRLDARARRGDPARVVHDLAMPRVGLAERAPEELGRRRDRGRGLRPDGVALWAGRRVATRARTAAILACLMGPGIVAPRRRAARPLLHVSTALGRGVSEAQAARTEVLVVRMWRKPGRRVATDVVRSRRGSVRGPKAPTLTSPSRCTASTPCTLQELQKVPTGSRSES